MKKTVERDVNDVMPLIGLHPDQWGVVVDAGRMDQHIKGLCFEQGFQGQLTSPGIREVKGPNEGLVTFFTQFLSQFLSP